MSLIHQPGSILWTRQFVGERWPEPITPLSVSLMVERFVGDFLYFPRMQGILAPGTRPTRIAHGHVYMNTTMFQGLFEQARFPVPDFIKELFPSEMRRELGLIRLGLPEPRVLFLALYTALKDRIFEMIDLNILRNPTHWERFLEGYLAEIGELRAIDIASLTDLDLLAYQERCERLLFAYRRIHLGSLLLGNCVYQVLGWFIHRWTKLDPAVLKAQIVSGLSGSKTLETNKSLWLLASEAARVPATRQLFAGQSREDILDQLGKPEHRQFQAFLKGFLDHYGHRCHNSYELASAAWARNPLPVIEAVRSYLQDDDALRGSPFEHEKRMREERLQATARFLLDLRAASFGPAFAIKRRLFNGLLDLTHRYMLLRENQRFFFDMVLKVLKDAYLQIGERLTARGLLDQAEDIFFLRAEEVAPALRGQWKERSTVEARKLAHKTAGQHCPPTYLINDTPFHDVVEDSPNLAGLGVSPGVGIGEVRIVNVPGDFSGFRHGEVLVTTGTDPGWTPLFIRAGALVTEIGGLLSHGAVVAREYGLPAVVGVPNATHVLRNGQRVMVDGSKGAIRIL